jgi:hypothetical protein
MGFERVEWRRSYNRKVTFVEFHGRTSTWSLAMKRGWSKLFISQTDFRTKIVGLTERFFSSNARRVSKRPQR